MGEYESASIACVDDEPVVLNFLQEILAAEGCVTRCFSSGQALLEDRETLSTCDMILLDVAMPTSDGIRICQRIRRMENRFLPIILMTGFDSVDCRVRGFDAGADDFVTKPFSIQELNARIRAHLRGKSYHDQLERLNRTLEARVAAQVREIHVGHLATIFALSKLAESRDPETGEHLDRICEFCRLLASQLRYCGVYAGQIDDRFVETLYTASPLHDIGKVGIADVVLLKPDRLSPEEFKIMEMHTIIGADTLREVLKRHPDNNLVRTGIEIAESHHENWNGSGYPFGLVGDEIPLSARIMALCDVYDALTSKRVYKAAFSHEKSVEIIRADRGRKFDPLVVDAFLELETEFRQVRERFSEGTGIVVSRSSSSAHARNNGRPKVNGIKPARTVVPSALATEYIERFRPGIEAPVFI